MNIKIRKIYKDLGLNSHEKAKVIAVIKAEKMKLKAIKEEKQNRLEAWLTPEQMEKLDALEQQRHQKIR